MFSHNIVLIIATRYRSVSQKKNFVGALSLPFK